MNYVEGRSSLLKWLKKQLIGPASGENLLRGSPLDRYPTGILFPIMRDEEGIDPASVSDDDDTENLGDDTTAESDAQTAAKRRRYMPPLSVGFSFFASGEEVRFQVVFSAARYEEKRDAGKFTDQYERVLTGPNSESFGCKLSSTNIQAASSDGSRLSLRSSRENVFSPYCKPTSHAAVLKQTGRFGRDLSSDFYDFRL